MKFIKFGYANFRLSSKAKDEGALLLNCHFDSWPTSPAGSDDLASCVILLELIQILGDPTAPALKHDLIFLFNGAEEAGLLASHGFITQHNERHRIKGFINLEASGSGGREVLFQSGPFSQWMLDAYLKAAPHPYCSVIGQEVFQSGIVPSDTDFRIFRDHGKISGLSFISRYSVSQNKNFRSGFRVCSKRILVAHRIRWSPTDYSRINSTCGWECSGDFEVSHFAGFLRRRGRHPNFPFCVLRFPGSQHHFLFLPRRLDSELRCGGSSCDWNQKTSKRFCRLSRYSEIKKLHPRNLHNHNF